MTAAKKHRKHPSPDARPAAEGQYVGTLPEEHPRQDQRTVTITLPSLGRVAGGAKDAALLPLAVARQVLPAKKGLPLYLGLGVLGAADVIEWPVAIGIGVGYAVLRRDGRVLDRPPRPSGPASA
ncbi:hypothetical protein [Streptomyces sp. NPDC047886]|uniref:hypothetical protein n=1 Tax=Streptomyces sp. NPDC047886 TaxID=3365490 RepID=UPI00371AF903